MTSAFLSTLTSLSALAANSAISVTFQNEKLPLTMNLYEVKSTFGDRVSETGIVSSLEKSPVGKPIPGSVALSPGTERSFVLVMHNSRKEPFYFFAVPHVMHPASSSVGLHFECLCTGKIYKVPPGSYWYRIVRLQTDLTFKAKAVDLRHSLVGIKESDAMGIHRKQLHESSIDH